MVVLGVLPADFFSLTGAIFTFSLAGPDQMQARLRCSPGIHSVRLYCGATCVAMHPHKCSVSLGQDAELSGPRCLVKGTNTQTPDLSQLSATATMGHQCPGRPPGARGLCAGPGRLGSAAWVPRLLCNRLADLVGLPHRISAGLQGWLTRRTELPRDRQGWRVQSWANRCNSRQRGESCFSGCRCRWWSSVIE